MNLLHRTALCATALLALISPAGAQVYIDVDTILDSRTYENYIVGNHTSPTVNVVTGADVWSLRSYSQSTINFRGGHYRFMEAYGNSTVDCTGGSFSATGGGRVSAYAHSIVNYSGSGADYLYSYDNSVVNLSGGGVSHYLTASGNSVFNVSGGVFAFNVEDGLIANDNATFNFFGVGLNATLVRSDRMMGTALYNDYVLSGRLLDGNDLATKHLYVQHDTGARFILHNASVPAPSSALVLLLGAVPGIALLRRRRA